MISSPCARLSTPSRPSTTARPRARIASEAIPNSAFSAWATRTGSTRVRRQPVEAPPTATARAAADSGAAGGAALHRLDGLEDLELGALAARQVHVLVDLAAVHRHVRRGGVEREAFRGGGEFLGVGRAG